MQTPAAVIAAACLFLAVATVPAQTNETQPGQGRRACSEFNELVNGDWSHPLNALNFHGYLSFALGQVAGHNLYGSDADVAVDMESLKQYLVEHCQSHPQETFGAAVDSYVREHIPR